VKIVCESIVCELSWLINFFHEVSVLGAANTGSKFLNTDWTVNFSSICLLLVKCLPVKFEEEIRFLVLLWS